MFTLSFSQAIPGPVTPVAIPSNLYAGFKDEFSRFFENIVAQYDWSKIQSFPSNPSEEELNYMLSLAENFGFCFL